MKGRIQPMSPERKAETAALRAQYVDDRSELIAAENAAARIRSEIALPNLGHVDQLGRQDYARAKTAALKILRSARPIVRGWPR